MGWEKALARWNHSALGVRCCFKNSLCKPFRRFVELMQYNWDMNDISGIKRKLDDTLLREVLVLFSQGYTIRYIRNFLEEKTDITPTETELLQIASYFGKDVEALRDQMAEQVLTTGLGRKEERVRRLGELAEEWEERAKISDKAAKVYQNTLKQIQNETEPLGIRVIIPKDDPWYQLMQQLQDSKTE